MSNLRPTLIFDGECGICRTWVDYWAQLTGDRVAYRPYQEAALDLSADPALGVQARDAARPPRWERLRRRRRDLPPADLCAGADYWWWLYRYLPGFAPAERGGVLLSLGPARTADTSRRGPVGPHAGAESYALVSWLFLRGLGLIYVAAFASLAVQIQGLVGHDGILPVARYLAAAHGAWEAVVYWRCRRCSGSTQAIPRSLPGLAGGASAHS